MPLAPHEDAFGQMLLDTLAGETGYEIVERDDGYLDISRAGEAYLQLPRRPEPGTRELLDAARGRVLDVGCGGGRYALALQRRGHEVLGIDTSPGAIEAVRRRGLERTRLLSARAVTPELGLFDTVLLGGNNFGLMETPRRARALLTRFAAITPDDGQILATSLDVTDTDNPRHLDYQKQNVRRGRMPGQLRLRIRWKDLKTPWFDYLMVSPTQMQEVLEGSAFRLTRTIPLRGPTYAAVLTKI